MSNTKHSTFRTVVTLVVSACLIGVAALLLFNRQYILDTVANASYKPTAEVTAITERTQLSSSGRFTFYATSPEILAQEAFNSSCPRQESTSPILGCYTSADRIYIYNVTDARLDGMKEVTAVHEMLHAVWMRKSPEEKKALETQLRQAYAQRADGDLKKRMEYYDRTEPGEFVNELHSILGTEVDSLGSDLESYYGTYFNRSAVLAFHAQYSSTYKQLTSRADQLASLMGVLSKTIDAKSKTYTEEGNAFSQDVATFNSRASNGGFTSQSQFTAERSRLLARSGQLAAMREDINASIATYNSYYEEYQTISKQVEGLNKSLDSYQALGEAPSV